MSNYGAMADHHLKQSRSLKTNHKAGSKRQHRLGVICLGLKIAQELGGHTKQKKILAERQRAL